MTEIKRMWSLTLKVIYLASKLRLYFIIVMREKMQQGSENKKTQWKFTERGDYFYMAEFGKNA